jgi:quinoprotein dehydrogenase-associated probable ABC transporter substrate-binding protein
MGGILSRAAPAVLALLLATGGPLRAAPVEAVDRSVLRVCADPSSMPFSDQAGEGFENKIAELLAQALHVPVRYTWYPDSTGFIRNTLLARRCDLVMGTVMGNDMVQGSNPYYHSSFALVYRSAAGPAPASLDDPVLRSARIGVIAGTPPATLLAMRGLLPQVRSYELVTDTRANLPARQLVQDVATGAIDVGIVWGPIGGYYAKHASVPLTVVPLRSDPSAPVPLDFQITMGMRHNEPDWRHAINRLIQEQQPAIDRILADYGVPLLDERGESRAPPP